MDYLSAAEHVLREAEEPLHYRAITQRTLDGDLIETQAKTPWATMNSRLSTSISQRGENSPFVRTAPGVFALRVWVAEGKVEALDRGVVFIPHYPIYAKARAALLAWDGAPAGAITSMRAAIQALTGTPQHQMDWTDPDTWIDQRLTGEDRHWASQTWEGSGKTVNPRHTLGHSMLASHYDLLETSGGTLRLSDRGREFVEQHDGEWVQNIDRSQGVGALLELVAEIGPAPRAKLLGPWGDQARNASRLRSDAAIKAALWGRLRNLLTRGYLEKSGHAYAVTEDGLEYLNRVLSAEETGDDDARQLRRLLREQKRNVRDGLRSFLSEIDPYAFEHLVRRLLEEIGYDDVEVTSPSNDKGVDVVGTIQLGITTVKEVVQVKRFSSNVQRPVLDALRGVLHRFGAVRGTIITIGDFSKGTREAAFEAGAAPITLIDGEKLMDLLIENELGVRKRQAELWELDSDSLVSDEHPSE